MPRLLLVMLVVWTAGCEKPCEFPAGKYELTYAPLEGDCPEELIKEFGSQKTEIDIEGGQCRKFSFQHAARMPNGCDLAIDMSAELKRTGVKQGQAATTLNCTKPKKYVCRQLFSVEYRRKP